MSERLTTAQAEKRTGASRWAILRAHKAGALQGERDNRGRWVWDADELDRWNEGREHPEAAPAPQEPQEVERLRSDLMEARERAARAEGERDGLREALTDARGRAEAAERRAAAAESETARMQAAAGRRWRWPWER